MHPAYRPDQSAPPAETDRRRKGKTAISFLNIGDVKRLSEHDERGGAQQRLGQEREVDVLEEAGGTVESFRSLQHIRETVHVKVDAEQDFDREGLNANFCCGGKEINCLW